MKKSIIILIGLALLGCKKQSDETFSKPERTVEAESGESAGNTELLTKAATFFKSISTVKYEAIPQDKIDLGKKLFFDKRLSKNESVSCNSCHNMSTFGVDNKATSEGDTHVLGKRNSPSVFYAFLHSMQFWDGRAKTVEDQAAGPMLNPIEHSMPNEAFLVNKLKSIAEYKPLFQKAFPGEKNPLTFGNITKAIGAFERQLMPVSRFDKYLDGDMNAINEQEQRGLSTFINTGCITCHTGVTIGGSMMQKFGVHGDYSKLTHSKNIDKGLYELTKNDADMYMFKVPSLRNVEKTSPYFHDGSVASLKEAVKIIAKLQLNKDVSDSDADDIVAFLKTLTADVDAKYKE